MRPALALLLLALPLAAAPVPKDAKAKPISLNGTWEMTERHANGDKEDLTTTIRWTIDGEKVVIEMAGRGRKFKPVENASYTLVKSKDGGENGFDYTLVRPDGSTPAMTFRGIVQQDGDTFKFCLPDTVDGGRPAECKAAKGTTMYVFKRVDAK